MRKTLGVAALMLALCCPALAGEIPNPPAPGEIPNPPAPTSPMQEPTDDAAVNGEMHTGVSDILAETALDLLAVLPALL
jgi:hypothetical protein